MACFMKIHKADEAEMSDVIDGQDRCHPDHDVPTSHTPSVRSV